MNAPQKPRTAVIKIGSSTLTDAEGKVDRAYIAESLAHQVDSTARRVGTSSSSARGLFLAGLNRWAFP